MASNNVTGDRLLWTAVIVGGVAAYWYIPYFLNHVKDLSAVTTPPAKQAEPQLRQDAEDAIKPETLAVLASGSNYNLTASAIRLTASRFVKDAEAQRGLLRDLSSNEWHRRDRAIKAFQLLLAHPALKDNDVRQHFLPLPTYSAFVDALVNLLPEHRQDTKLTSPPPLPSSPVKPPTRSVHERAIMELIITLLEEPRSYGSKTFYAVDAPQVIYAGIITKWLKHYPFPCTLPQNRHYNFKRSDVCRLLERDVWDSDDPAMARLIQILLQMPTGARQLADAGLRTSSIHDRANIGSREWATRSHPTLTFSDLQNSSMWNHDDDDTEFDNDDQVGQLIDTSELLTRLQDTRQRNQDGRTAGERSRQRRHRQAVVVAEAGAPLRPENILQRQPTETELAWQQEIQDRQGQLLRRASRRSAVGVDENAYDQLARERIDGLGEGAENFPPFQLPDLDELRLSVSDRESATQDALLQENAPPE